MLAQTIASTFAQAPISTVASPRLASLDIFRGLTVAAMILVTDPGTYDAVYPPLRHALWTGATPTDMIFPAFLFIVGVAIPLSLESRLRRAVEPGLLAFRVLRRSLLLLLAGLLLNAVPDFAWHTLRLPGILQRIAVCYLCGSLLYLALRPRSPKAAYPAAPTRLVPGLSAIAIFLWGSYWLALKLIPVPGLGPGHLDPYGNLPAYLDRAVFGIHHLWAFGLAPGRGVTYDPEGLLSTVPAVASTLVGVLAGIQLRANASPTRKALILAAGGLLLLLLSVLLSPWMPINKRIWTPTFAFLSSGVCLCLFALLYRLIDAGPAPSRRTRPWTLPAVIFGTNALLAFTLSGLLTSALDRIHIPAGAAQAPTLHTFGFHLFTPWLSPVNASLAYAVVIVLLNLMLIYPFYRRRLFLSL